MKLDDFVNDLNDTLQGCIAMDSVILGQLNYVADKYKQPHFHNYAEALDLIQKHGVECDECPECGWFSEGNFYEHPDHEGVCSDCEVEEEY